jgi:hypothetical protein
MGSRCSVSRRSYFQLSCSRHSSLHVLDCQWRNIHAPRRVGTHAREGDPGLVVAVQSGASARPILALGAAKAGMYTSPPEVT